MKALPEPLPLPNRNDPHFRRLALPKRNQTAASRRYGVIVVVAVAVAAAAAVVVRTSWMIETRPILVHWMEDEKGHL